MPDWIGSGDPFRTFHAAQVSGEPHALQRTGTPWLGLVRGAGAIAPAPVWIGTLSALALWWRNRDRTVAALALVAAAWTLPTVIGTALGYPAVPRYLFEPVAICCVLAGIGLVALVRRARDPRVRAALAVTLAVHSAPFVVTRATGLGRQAAWAEGWADQASALVRAVDRAERHAPVARLHPVVEPGAMANGLAWKLSVRLDDVSRVVHTRCAHRVSRRQPARRDRATAPPRRNRSAAHARRPVACRPGALASRAEGTHAATASTW